MTRNELESKSQDELIDIIEDLQEDIKELEDEKSILDDQVDGLAENHIKDLDNFIFRLKLDNLYTPEIEKFIDEYTKWYNK